MIVRHESHSGRESKFTRSKSEICCFLLQCLRNGFFFFSVDFSMDLSMKNSMEKSMEMCNF